MAVNNSKPVVRRLHKGRVYGCLIILLFIICVISALISGCTKRHRKEKADAASSAVDVVAHNTTETTKAEYKKEKYIICIDPGHGGNDNGGDKGPRLEKDDNLRYATEVYNILKEKENIEVIISRTDSDTYISNSDRAKFANDAKADLYLALHRNHSEDPTAKGVEVWIQQDKDVVDEVLGYKLLTALENVGIQDNRGVQSGFTNDSQNNFQIIEYTNMPCCIVEMGFISNDEDNRLFDEHYKDYAKAIADVAVAMCTEGYLDDKSE